jgi:NAD(P)-dependent dehydrogenase (short-subunit alcohol dehydrogenase family)
MTVFCEGRVAVVTGAGRGLGRAHAMALAAHGARVVVNDLGGGVDGSGASPGSPRNRGGGVRIPWGGSSGPAEAVVEEIIGAGGSAVASTADCAGWDGAERIVQTAIGAFGRLDELVANAGILRDRMLVNMTADDWDAVMRVHLRGTFCTAHWAAAHWRERSKAGEPVDSRLICTSSVAGLYGNIGQANFAIAPAARTRMTEDLFPDAMKPPEDGFDAMAPENVSPVVVWLASPESKGVTGRVFEVMGGRLGIAEGWRHGPVVQHEGAFDPDDVGAAIAKLLAEAAEPTGLLGA